MYQLGFMKYINDSNGCGTISKTIAVFIPKFFTQMETDTMITGI
jgi:hypothetical protein